MNFLLYLGLGAAAYFVLTSSGGEAGPECLDSTLPGGPNGEAAKQLLALLNEPHTRAELDAAAVLLELFPRAQACVRAKRGSDE